MSVRFRIRTSAGQELSFATHEMFEDFVRSGDLAPGDLVYDAETGSWAPSRTHPIVLDIEYEKEAAAAAVASDDSASGDAPAGTDDSATGDAAEPPAADSSADGSFGLSLAPEQDPAEDEDTPATAGQPSEPPAGEGAGDSDADTDDLDQASAFGLDLMPAADLMSPDEAAQAFVDKMEAERRDEIEIASVDQASIRGFAMEDSTTFADLSRAAPPPPPEQPRRGQPRRGQPRRGQPRREQPKRAKIARPAKKPRKSPLRRVVTIVILLAVLGGGAWMLMQLLNDGAIGVGAEPPDSVDVVAVDATPPSPPPPEPVIANTESAVRERAQELLLTATQALFRDLSPVPDAWPTGEYLAGPSAHEDVLGIWAEYLTTIRQVRSGDTDRYQTAYEAALDDAVIVGEARTERLAVAMADFAALDPLRAGHFDRVEALATAAIQSHNALLEAEGLILYEATESTGGRAGIGEGASGRDADAQLLLDQVLELLSSTLDADGLGPREGSNVREWVWDGYLDAVTN